MKILIAIDGSQVSHHEVQHALQLVRNGLQASFVLANVQEAPSTYERLTAQGNEEMLANVAFGAGTDALAESVRLIEQAGVSYTTEVISSGNPAQSIIELVHLHGCNLIITGTRAQSRLRNVLGGSVSRELIDYAPVPVLVVKLPDPILSEP